MSDLRDAVIALAKAVSSLAELVNDGAAERWADEALEIAKRDTSP